MKTYITYRNDIRGLYDVLETVKVVEKVASSSIRRLKQEIQKIDSCVTQIRSMSSRMLSFFPYTNHPLVQSKTGTKNMLVILTGDSGLVGSLWHDIVNVSLDNIKRYEFVTVVGSKGDSYLGEEGVLHRVRIDLDLRYLIDNFKKGAMSQIDILYPEFISLTQSKHTFVTFLPLEVERTAIGEGLPIFEPSKHEVLDNLLLLYIQALFRKVIVETKLSEFSARAVSMEQASLETSELMRKFTLGFLKKKRKIITQRQLESFVAHKKT